MYFLIQQDKTGFMLHLIFCSPMLYFSDKKINLNIRLSNFESNVTVTFYSDFILSEIYMLF